MNREPVFVVGVARSGTTLLTAMLSAHSSLSCGPETHFFRRLAEVEVDQLCDPETWPEPAANFISSIRHSAFTGYESKSLLEKYELDPAQIADYLADKKPAIPNILASVTEQYMTRLGKRRWIEKTPDHLEFVHLIRKYFPVSPIVRIIRDPRDVALSLMRVPWGASLFLEALLFWKRLDEASAEFFSTDQNSLTVRFEDLISDTEAELKKLCEFVGEDYEQVMLDTSSSGRRVNSRNVPWKTKASQSPDTGRIASWRNELTREENQLAEALLGDRLVTYAYPQEEGFDRLGEIYPSALIAPKYVDGLKSVAASGVRFWKTDQGESPSVKIYLGDPGYDNWLQGKKSEKLVNTLSISSSIVKARLQRDTVCWIPEPTDDQWSGYSAYLLKKLLTPYRLHSKPAARNRETSSVRAGQ